MSTRSKMKALVVSTSSGASFTTCSLFILAMVDDLKGKGKRESWVLGYEDGMYFRGNLKRREYAELYSWAGGTVRVSEH
jgi:hypothetical protein